MLVNPIQGSTRQKNNMAYSADSGADIGCAVGTPVVAAAPGTVLYSEWGHTIWGTTKNPGVDTPFSILIELDRPLVVNGKSYYYHWYTHLKALRFSVPDDGRTGPHVEAGTLLGYSGVGNRVPHLHFGILSDRRQRGPSDWLAPAKVVDLLWPDKPTGEADVGLHENAEVHGPPVLLTGKIFQRGKKLTVILDGRTYVCVGVKERHPDGSLRPWDGSEIIFRYRP